MRRTAEIIRIADALPHNSPMPVRAVRCYWLSCGFAGFPVCPHCQMTMNREYQSFCDHCGQALDWKDFDHALIILPR